MDPTTNGCDDRGYNVNTAYSYSVPIHLMDDLKSLLSPVIRQIKEVVKNGITSYSTPTNYNQKAIGMIIVIALLIDSLQDLYCFIESFPELINSIFWLLPNQDSSFVYLLNTIKSKIIISVSYE